MSESDKKIICSFVDNVYKSTKKWEEEDKEATQRTFDMSPSIYGIFHKLRD